MIIPENVYKILKWVVIIFLPALNTLIFTLGNVIGFDSNIICGIISAVTVFLGALIGVSTRAYNKGASDESK